VISKATSYLTYVFFEGTHMFCIYKEKSEQKNKLRSQTQCNIHVVQVGTRTQDSGEETSNSMVKG